MKAMAGEGPFGYSRGVYHVMRIPREEPPEAIAGNCTWPSRRGGRGPGPPQQPDWEMPPVPGHWVERAEGPGRCGSLILPPNLRSKTHNHRLHSKKLSE